MTSCDASHATLIIDGRKGEERHLLTRVDAAHVVSVGEEGATEDDACNLTNLSDATLLHNLRLRFESDEVYTWTGSIITSVNPCKPVPTMYDESRMRAARQIGATRNPAPHIFAIAEGAYADMLASGRNQACVVSGISGAGKTEASKLILQYLCWRAGGEGAVEPPALARAVVQSNPIFEAFGNAVTQMNPNSSRFGKFLKLSFDRGGSFASAAFSTFLLEKSRLVKHAPDARTFHVFFQLLAGASDNQLAQLQLHRNTGAHHYLRSAAAADGRVDAAEFATTDTALAALALSPSDVWRVIGGLLHLGNVAFEACDEDDDTSQVCDASDGALRAAEELLGLRGLARDLTIHEVRAGGARSSLHEVPLTADQAALSRDSLAKRIYAGLFDGLVRSLNGSMGADADAGSAGWIGCLDVFGFELFDTNSFEQLLVNYANERLQSFFLDSIFHFEQALYRKEQLEWSSIELPDNSACVAVIEGKPVGLLALLDEQCRLGERGTDAAFCLKVNRDNASCAAEAASLCKNQQARARFDESHQFVLAHFVEPVTYTAADFLQKNRDAFFPHLAASLACSSSDFVRGLCPAPAPAEALRANGTGVSFGTVASGFASSLTALINELRATRASFVRCVKPNASLTPGNFDERLALQQLRTCGQLEAVHMMRAMFPMRIDIDALHQKFIQHLPSAQSLSARDFCIMICQAFDVPPHEYAVGLTKLFFRAGGSAAAVALQKLCHREAKGAESAAELVTLRWKLRIWRREAATVASLRRWAARTQARGASAAPKVPTGPPSELPPTADVLAYRSHRRDFVIKLVRARAATRVAKHTRGAHASRSYRAQRRGACDAQTAFRRFVQRRAYRHARADIVRLQSAARRRAAIVPFVAYRRAAVKVQAAQRGAAAVGVLRRALRAAVTLQRQTRWRARQDAATSIQTSWRLRIWRAKRVAAVGVVHSTWQMVCIRRQMRSMLRAVAELQRGAVFSKYRVGGNHEPHRRYVWLSSDLKHFRWCRADEQPAAGRTSISAAPSFSLGRGRARHASIGSRTAGANYDGAKAMATADVCAISAGAKTELMKKMGRKHEKRGSVLDSDCCFSVISPARRLDLVAPDQETRDRWVANIQLVLVHGHTIEAAEELVRQATMRPASRSRGSSSQASRGSRSSAGVASKQAATKPAPLTLGEGGESGSSSSDGGDGDVGAAADTAGEGLRKLIRQLTAEMVRLESQHRSSVEQLLQPVDAAVDCADRADAHKPVDGSDASSDSPLSLSGVPYAENSGQLPTWPTQTTLWVGTPREVRAGSPAGPASKDSVKRAPAEAKSAAPSWLKPFHRGSRGAPALSRKSGSSCQLTHSC